MTLAAPVTDREGKTLLAAGICLDPATIERITRRGIEAVAVDQADPRDEPELAAERAATEQRLAHIFRGDGSAARHQLHAATLAWRLESLR
jgi:hypothetical protein